MRIALQLKGLAYETVHIDLLKGEQKTDNFREKNPQGLVPLLVDGDVTLAQSMAMIEYLDEAYPDSPRLVYGSPEQRALIRQLSMIIACEVAPLNNPKVWKGYVGVKLGADDAALKDWYAHWIYEGFDAYEALLHSIKTRFSGPFSAGERPSMADACLLPQLYNARRFSLDLDPYPGLCAAEKALMALPTVQKAAPECHPDAPTDLEVIHGPNAPFLKSAA